MYFPFVVSCVFLMLVVIDFMLFDIENFRPGLINRPTLVIESWVVISLSVPKFKLYTKCDELSYPRTRMCLVKC